MCTVHSTTSCYFQRLTDEDCDELERVQERSGLVVRYWDGAIFCGGDGYVSIQMLWDEKVPTTLKTKSRPTRTEKTAEAEKERTAQRAG